MVNVNTCVSENNFPCKNPPLVISKKYPNCEFKLAESSETEERLLVLENGIVTKEEPVAKMTPGCRFTDSFNAHLDYPMDFYVN
jgi:hypothetical protein